MDSRLINEWSHNWFGFWREGQFFADCPYVEDFINENSCEDTHGLLLYLKSAPAISVFAAKYKCSLCDIELPVGKQSDGVFTWPLDLPHYVENHKVVLPKNFTEHIRKMNYEIPDSMDIQLEKLTWPKPAR